MVSRMIAVALALALPPWCAEAGITSSDSSSNCSGGRCTVIETHSFDGRGHRGVVGQYRSWVEPQHRRWVEPYDGPRHWREGPRRRGRSSDRDD